MHRRYVSLQLEGQGMIQAQDFLDFDVEIRSESGGYRVVVVASPAGEVSETSTFPFGDLELENRLLTLERALLRSGGSRRLALSEDEKAIQAFGRALFEFLLPGEVRSHYRSSRTEARRQGKGLRLKLRIQTPELASLPWEYLFDPQGRDYVCLSGHTPIVRYLEVGHPRRPLAVSSPLRILGMVADPRNDLNVELEKTRVERALAPLGGSVELVWLEGETRRALQRALRRESWHIFHFIGHGAFDKVRDEGLLMLADDQGDPSPLYATPLARLLGNHQSLRLAVINACEGAQGGMLDIFSSTASILMSRGLPAAVAMQYEITDAAAIEFTTTFYEALADGLPVDRAITEARMSISGEIDNTLEWGVPVLHMRAPDGHLFRVQSEKKSSVAAPDSEPDLEREPEPSAERRIEAPAVHLRRPIEIDWVTIPAGDFLMGSDKSKDPKAYDDELPQHTLYLPEYRIARSPVTVAQFSAFVEATNHKTTAEVQGSGWAYTGSKWDEVEGAYWVAPRGPDSDVSQKSDHPVTQVSWHDALAFCEWAGVQLPSEAEWEKAARGSDGRIYPWGNESPNENLCNFNMNVKDTTPVGSYPGGRSPYGLYDMAGNVWEWTRSLWGREVEQPDFGYPYNPDDGRENRNAPDSILRVVRGGSFFFNVDLVRCADRGRSSSGIRNLYDVGFRVVSPPGF